MSALPEPPPDREKEAADDDCFLQWVALVVLMACWLAEAYV